MSSPDVKIQSILRKYRNNIRNEINERKNIVDFSHNISNDASLKSIDISKSKTVLIADVLNKSENVAIEHNNHGPSYIDIIKNVYNSEFCDNEWLIFMHFINKTYPNFENNDKYKIKTLFLNDISPLSAMHHFIYNSDIHLSNLEWEWSIACPNIRKNFIKREYRNTILRLTDKNICTFNNINYIINETINSYSKINHMVNTGTEYNDYLASAILSIKLLDSSCIFYTKLPVYSDFNEQIMSILLLYSLIFSEVYIFDIKIEDLIQPYLICKNKKKITTEVTYKKLLSCIDCENIFHQDFVKDVNKEWYEKMIKIIEEEKNNCVDIVDIKDEINEFLSYNYKTLS